MQDIFLRLWGKKEDLGKIKALNNYLFSIARNKMLNRYDHLKVQRKAITYIGRRTEEAGSSNEDHYVYKEYNEVVQMALSALPPKRRQVFEMSTPTGTFI